MRKLIDLHTHSNMSDGTLTPTELVKHARDSNLAAIAITDHDTVDGVDESKRAGKALGVEVIEGVELVAEYRDTEIHILAYFLDYKGQYFLNKLTELKAIRADRNERLFLRLTGLGMDIAKDELKRASGGNTLTRLHFAKVMYEKGYVKSVKDAFERYLNYGCPAFVGRNAFSYGECIDIIKGAGGISVLAHPYIYKWKGGEVLQMLETLTESGINGVEAIYPLHSEKETRALFNTAKKLNLIITGGSDFHGANKPDIKIGAGKGNISVDYEVLDRLRSFKDEEVFEN